MGCRTGLSVSDLIEQANAAKAEQRKADAEKLRKETEKLKSETVVAESRSKDASASKGKETRPKSASGERKDAPPYKVRVCFLSHISLLKECKPRTGTLQYPKPPPSPRNPAHGRANLRALDRVPCVSIWRDRSGLRLRVRSAAII